MVPRREKHNPWALPLSLVYGVRRLHARLLRQLILGDNNAFTALRIPGDGHGYEAKLRPFQALTGGEEVVAICVENDAVRHSASPPSAVV